MAVFAETPALDAGEPRAFHGPTCSLPLSPPCAPQRDTEAAAVRAAGRSTAEVLDVTDLDGSLAEDAETPLDFEANVAVTREMVEYAHARGVTVEGELGTLVGIEAGVGSGETVLVYPGFITRTGVDPLAVAIGTSHGAYKFSREPDGEILATHLVEEIHRRLPDTHLVMHGSSSVPADLVERVNAAGGEITSGFGVPVAQIRPGIEHGVRKVDIDTDGRLAITATTREALRDEPGNWDPRHVGKAARMGMRELVAERMLALGMAGHAGDYEPLTLEQMRDRYAAGTSAVV